MQTMAVSSRRDIDKYVKFFCVKAAQTIIQSRSGEKLATRCNPDMIGVDWFNISLPNNGMASDVQNEIKALYGRHCPAVEDPFCVDVILRTAEGLDMLVETWKLYAADKTDNSVKVHYTVYNRLAVLLKTLISFTRALPAHRVSRRKNKDFSFMYRLYSGSRLTGNSEELNMQSTIGTVKTPFYSISVEVSYRELIHIDAKHATYHSSTGLKKPVMGFAKDGFQEHETFSQGIVDEIAKAASENITSSSATLPHVFLQGSRYGEESNSWMSKEISEAIGEIEFIEKSPSVSEFGLSNDSGKAQDSKLPSKHTGEEVKDKTYTKMEPSDLSQDDGKSSGPPSGQSKAIACQTLDIPDGFPKIGYIHMAAFADFSSLQDSVASMPTIPSTPPLLSCLEEQMNFVSSDSDNSSQHKQSEDTHKNASSCSDQGGTMEAENGKASGSAQGLEDGQPQAHAVGFEDDFVLVELRPAFSFKEGEAVSLFREAQNPPYLDLFTVSTRSDEEVRSFKEILSHYEEEFQRFDKLFHSIGYLEVS